MGGLGLGGGVESLNMFGFDGGVGGVGGGGGSWWGVGGEGDGV